MRIFLQTIALSLLFVCVSSLTLSAQTATVSTDQSDYAPGSTAIITGSGFQPGETVTLQVLHDPTGGDDATSPAHQPWTVVADASGNINSTWLVPGDADELGATLQLTAVGQSSGLTASVVFTDAITVYPNGLSINTNTDQTVCVGNSATTLIATMATCSNGGGSPTNNTLVTYKWYYNITASNNISGATLVKTTSTTTATLSDSYTPPSASADAGSIRYYFCQITFSPANHGNGCGGDGRTGYPYTTSVDKVTVNALPNPPTAINYSNAYDGNSHTASATVGSGEVVDWYAAATGSTTAAAPIGTNVGTYSAYAEARNSITGCVSSSRTLVTVIISKAPSTTTVTINGGPFIYSGLAQTPATVSVTGAGGLNLTPTASYSNNTNAGTATVSYTYAGDANHNGSSDSKNFTIDKADPTVVVTGYHATYDGSGHTATYTISGVNGETNATVGTIDVTNTTHTNAGTYNGDAWAFTGSANYNNTSGTVNDLIDKANASISITGFTGNYNGLSRAATAFAYGVGGINDVLSPAVTLSYTGTFGAANTAYGPTSTAPYQAGTYTATATFAGNNNYNGNTGTASITINNIPINATATATNILCNGGSSTLTVNATGGDGALTYSLNGGPAQNTNQFTVNAAGSPYTVTVQDADGFTKNTNTVTVSQPAVLTSSCTATSTNLYYGVNGYQSSTITATPAGGTGPYTISITMNRALLCDQVTNSGDEIWVGNGGNTNVPLCGKVPISTNTVNGSYSVTVTLMTDADITATITDANGCTTTCTIHIKAVDARCWAGKSNIQKVAMCHYTGSSKNPYVNICVDSSAVASHLALGDKLGVCGAMSIVTNGNYVISQQTVSKLEASVLPNPTSYYFNINVRSASMEKVKLTVVDVLGRTVERRSDVPANSTFLLGNNYHPGIYFVELMQGKDRVILKLIKEGK